MTEITEVKTGAAPTTDLICPLMSGQLAPSKPGPGEIAPPGVMILKPTIVVCVRENCRWWDESSEQCTLLSIAEEVGDVSNCLVTLRNVLEPPTESPLVRIADTLNHLLTLFIRRAEAQRKGPV